MTSKSTARPSPPTWTAKKTNFGQRATEWLRKAVMMAKQVSWTEFLIALITATAAVVVWAYSTFLTLREREAAEAIQITRLNSLEAKYDSVMASQYEIKGQLGTLVLMVQQIAPKEAGKK